VSQPARQTGSTRLPSPAGLDLPGLSDAQRRVLAAVDDEAVTRLASDLVRIPSSTTEETPCAERLAGYLADHALEVELQEIEPGRKQTLARLCGAGGGRSIMLNGHIDIDPLPSGWRRDPFAPGSRTAGSTVTASCCLYGPGGGYADYHDVHVNLDELYLVTRVLALTALEATA
jgi:hypothetical protein